MKRLSLLLFSLLFSFQLFAQSVPAETGSNKMQHNHQNWFTYFGQYKLSDKWGIHADVQFRMDEKVQAAKQNLLRAGLIRYLNTNLNFTAGYAYINSQATFLSRGATINYYSTEHRIWKQFIYNHKPANHNMTHRFRLEQRFVKKLGIGPDDRIASNYVFGNRVRYFN